MATVLVQLLPRVLLRLRLDLILILLLLLLLLLLPPLDPPGHGGWRGGAAGHLHAHSPHLAVLGLAEPRRIVGGIALPGYEVFYFRITVVLEIDVAVDLLQNVGKGGAVGAALGGLDGGCSGVIERSRFIIDIAAGACPDVSPPFSTIIGRLWLIRTIRSGGTMLFTLLVGVAIGQVAVNILTAGGAIPDSGSRIVAFPPW